MVIVIIIFNPYENKLLLLVRYRLKILLKLKWLPGWWTALLNAFRTPLEYLCLMMVQLWRQPPRHFRRSRMRYKSSVSASRYPILHLCISRLLGSFERRINWFPGSYKTGMNLNMKEKYRPISVNQEIPKGGWQKREESIVFFPQHSTGPEKLTVT
jgi:hypothetical protein